MNTDRRSLLKGIAVAGMVIPGMHWAYALPVDMGQQGLSWPIGVPFISGQIRRILPDVLRTLDC